MAENRPDDGDYGGTGEVGKLHFCDPCIAGRHSACAGSCRSCDKGCQCGHPASKWWRSGRHGGYVADCPPRDALHADFVKLIEYGMARRKWSRADLARSMGVSPPHITNVLGHPEKLSLNVMLAFAEAVGVTLRLRDGRPVDVR